MNADCGAGMPKRAPGLIFVHRSIELIGSSSAKPRNRISNTSRTFSTGSSLAGRLKESEVD